MYTAIFYEKPTEEDSHSGFIHLWDELNYKKIPYSRYAYKLDPSGTYKTLYGQSCKKVTRWSNDDVENGKIFESDLNPEMRYLIDNYTEYETPSDNHVELFFDIEVDTTNGLPDIDKAKNEITAISYYDKKSKEYVALILDRDGDIEKQEYDSMQNERIKVIPFDNEMNLLERFMDDWLSIRPTICTGWNIDNFDIPYLYNRICRLFGEEYANQFSPIQKVYWNKMRQRYFIAGVSCLDYMQLYKTFTFGQRISFSLDAIGKLEINMGKIKYEGTLNKLYAENKEKYIEYNIHDVRIVVKLDEKLKFIDLAKGIAHKGHVQFEDVYFSSRYLDGAILTYMKKKNLVAPNRPKHESSDNDDDKFAGAYVKDPIPGKYEWIIDLDYTSLYPSIIMSLNISPETKIAKIEGWNNSDYVLKKDTTYKIDLVEKVLTLNNEKMHKFLDETKFSVSSNGILYDMANPGIIPSILSQWFDERIEYKNLMKKYGKEKNDKMYEYYYMRQYIQKVILNSLYGVLGLPSFRFYDLENAVAVTATGQDLIKYAQKVTNLFFSKELGETKDYVIYCDTDSVFASVTELVKKYYPNADWTNDSEISSYILEIAKKIQDFNSISMEYFSKKILNIQSHRFSLKQEIIAKSGFWTAKKRYALHVINKEGIPFDEMESTGLDNIRTNFPMAFRHFIDEILNDILKNVDKSIIDNKILELKSKMWSFEISDLARPTGVKDISSHYSSKNAPFDTDTKGVPVHVKSAINYNDFIKYHNLDKKYSLISDGEKIKWIYLKNNPLKFTELAFRDNGEDPKEILDYVNKYADLEKVFESELVKKLTDFYEALGWEQIPTKVNSTMSKFI